MFRPPLTRENDIIIINTTVPVFLYDLLSEVTYVFMKYIG